MTGQGLTSRDWPYAVKAPILTISPNYCHSGAARLDVLVVKGQ
jgi:hypothetical protein